VARHRAPGGGWPLTVALVTAAALAAFLIVVLAPPPLRPGDPGLRPVTPRPAITWEPPITGSAPTAATPTPPPNPRR